MQKKLARIVTWESDDETGARCVLDIWEIDVNVRNDGKLAAREMKMVAHFTSLYVPSQLCNASGGVSCSMEIIE